MTPKAQASARAENEEASAPAQSQVQDYIEFVGEPPYGNEFIDNRIITRRDAKAAWDFTMAKDLHWKKDGKGRMMVPVSEIPSEIRELLLEDNAFRFVQA